MCFGSSSGKRCKPVGALVATDVNDGHVIGSSRFHGYAEEADEIEIGWTFLARSYWGGVYNGEMKRLMLRHALIRGERDLSCRSRELPFTEGGRDNRGNPSRLKAGRRWPGQYYLQDHRFSYCSHGGGTAHAAERPRFTLKFLFQPCQRSFGGSLRQSRTKPSKMRRTG
jgi:hypothetical protein